MSYMYWWYRWKCLASIKFSYFFHLHRTNWLAYVMNGIWWLLKKKEGVLVTCNGKRELRGVGKNKRTRGRGFRIICNFIQNIDCYCIGVVGVYIYSMMWLFIGNYKPFSQEVSVDSLMLAHLLFVLILNRNSFNNIIYIYFFLIITQKYAYLNA